MAPVDLAAEDSAIPVLNADDGRWSAVLAWEGPPSGGGLPGAPHNSAATTFLNMNLIYLRITTDFIL